MKKRIGFFTMVLILVTAVIFLQTDTIYSKKTKYFINYKMKYYIAFKKVKVPDEYKRVDRNKNGVFDPIDIVNGARKEVKSGTKYKDAYYAEGFPPNGEGVCTDVIWRSFLEADINLKQLVDADIKNNIVSYPRIYGKPDTNIDFRRVPNLNVFFTRNAVSLTTKIIPGDVDNLKEWQPGDIIVILKPYQHIGIISDKRGIDGVPYLIHNTYPHAVETSNFDMSTGEISGHYRWKY